MLPLILGFGRRANPYRAFGDAVYLSDYWSYGAPSASEIDHLLTTLKRHQIYQCYYSVGMLAADGSFKYPDSGESFMWEADGWCAKQRYPMKFVAWLRKTREATADLRSQNVMRNLTYCLKFVTMFKGVHLDFEFWAEEQGSHFARLLELVRRDYPTMTLSVLARRSWLKWRGYAERLKGMVGDIEVNLFDSAREGPEYEIWCSQQVDSLITNLGHERLLLTVPAFHELSERHRAKETMQHALKGIKLGVSRHHGARVRVSVYRDGDATPDDWKAFDREWK